MVSRRVRKGSLEALPIKLITTRLSPAVAILACLTLMVFHKTDILPVERLRVAVTDTMAPVLSVASKPFALAGDYFSGVTTIHDLRAENLRLMEENARLQAWYESALRMQAENQAFRELLNVKADPSLVHVTARVVSDPGGAFVKSLLVPIGVKDGIAKGNAVMAGNGLIGRVVETGNRSARILLISDLNSRIPVTVQNTRTRAILAGRNDELLRLERLPPDSGLAIGQRIVTSGDGGQLPADIPVGVIVSVEHDNVLVRPLANLARVSHVQVINTNIDPALSTGDIAPIRY